MVVFARTAAIRAWNSFKRFVGEGARIVKDFCVNDGGQSVNLCEFSLAAGCFGQQAHDFDDGLLLVEIENAGLLDLLSCFIPDACQRIEIGASGAFHAAFLMQLAAEIPMNQI